MLHIRASAELGIDDYTTNPNVLAGVAVKRGKDWIMLDSFNLESKIRKGKIKEFKDMLKKDWTNPFINVEGYMGKMSRKKWLGQ